MFTGGSTIHVDVKQARIRHEKENVQLAYKTKKWETKYRRKIQIVY
jgi:hypothetical protein